MHWPPLLKLHRRVINTLGASWGLYEFIRPYRRQILLAVLVLMASTGAVLAFGQVLRAVVDSGLSSGSAPALNRSLVFFLIVVTTMTVAGLARCYLLA
ncbi:MAG: hypothetical protein WBJ41_13745 [Chromatiaceae bacterium]